MVHISFEIVSKFKFYSPMAAALVNKIRFTASGGVGRKIANFVNLGRKMANVVNLGKKNGKLGEF